MFTGYDDDYDEPPAKPKVAPKFEDDPWRYRGMDDDQLGKATIRRAGPMASIHESYSEQRLAMAWDEWSDKIRPRKGEGWQDYVIDHGPDEKEPDFFNQSVLGFTIKSPHEISIDDLYTADPFRNRGVAESLIRRLHEDYPNHKINPGGMTDDGQAFHDRMLQKEPDAKGIVAQANRLLLAMAWDEWAPKIQNKSLYGRIEACPEGGGCDHAEGKSSSYKIYHEGTNDPYPSYLNYTHAHAPVTREPILNINMLYANEDHRKDGIAEALMRRLNQDHPGVRIVPGEMSNQGQAFHNRMLEKEPTARELVRAAHRLLQAMAWDEWSDKIEHNAPEADGTPFGNQGCYTIYHGGSSANDSALLYSLNAEGPEDNSVFIDNLYSHPQFRNQGVAEALFRRLHQDYPDRKINPGPMTGEGQAFHDRMLEKEPTARDLVTAAQRVLLAMAWQDWSDQIKHSPPENEGIAYYTIPHSDGSESSLNYYINTDDNDVWDEDDDDPRLGIDHIVTSEPFRNRGVAESLFRRLHKDYPYHRIDPGQMTDKGQAFHDRMLEKEPSAKGIVAQANRLLLAMAWDEWSDKIEHVHDGYPKNKYIYQINHGPHPDYPQWPRTSFVSYWDGGRMGFSPGYLSIDLLQVHDDFQKEGVAEALMRKMHQDHPNHKIIPGEMSDKGQGFHDRMLEKEPDAKNIVAQANRLLMAMAWQDWAPKIKHKYTGPDETGWPHGRGSFSIDHSKDAVLRWNLPSYLDYVHHPNSDEIEIQSIQTHPEYRRDGVQESLFRKLHETYPDHAINPGMMTSDGRGFHDKMLQKEPAARDLVVGAEPQQEEGEIPDYQSIYAQKRTAAQAFGDCYGAALRYMMDNGSDPYSGSLLRLVHGEVAGQGPMEGKTFGHAWIEVHDPDNDEPMVIDPSNGRDLHMPISQYYNMGKINELDNYHSYTHQQAIGKALEHGVTGPWDLKGKHPNYVHVPVAEKSWDECEECGDELDEYGECQFCH